MLPKEKLLSAFVLLAFLFGASFANAAETNWSPKSDQIARLEKKLALPRGPRPIGDYARYYWGTTEQGTRVIRGTLVWGQQIGVHIMDRPLRQSVTDQGCNWIFIRYEPINDTVSAQCDGTG
jgi:hypothetical protein